MLQSPDFRKITLGFPSLQFSPFVSYFPPFFSFGFPRSTVSHFGFPCYARFPSPCGVSSPDTGSHDANKCLNFEIFLWIYFFIGKILMFFLMFNSRDHIYLCYLFAEYYLETLKRAYIYKLAWISAWLYLKKR